MTAGPIYHLALAAAWENAERAGEYRRSTIDRSLEQEGFIHCSFAEQVQATADRYYTGRADVVLLRIDPASIGAEVRVENGFPHVYGPIPLDAVVAARPVPVDEGGRLVIDGSLP